MNKFEFWINKGFLYLIIAVAILVRFWNLGSIPSGLTPDEAALGYNSYSILKTGADEWGKHLPIIFKSFGDYKPGAYVYFTLPFTALFGLSEFSTRAPSAIAGVLIVYLMYQVTLKLFKSNKLSLVVAATTSLNPWLIYFSRGAWEANVSLFLTIAAIYFFVLSLEKGKYLLLSALFFGLTIVTYQGAKLSSVFIVLALVFLYWKDVLKIGKKELISSVVVGLVISMPVILSLFNGQTNRLNIFSIFSYQRPEAEISQILSQDKKQSKDIFFENFHSENINYFRAVLGRYFNNFSGRFLFFDGDWANPVHTPPYQGVMLLSDLIFLPLGFFFIVKRKITKPTAFFLLWMFLAPLTSALSRDELNAVRDISLAIPLILIASFGMFNLIRVLYGVRFRFLSLFALFFCVAASILYFVDSYFIHVPSHNSDLWRYGYKQAFEFISPIKSNFNQVIFEQSYNQPYIYYLYYFAKEPKNYQNQQKMINSDYVGDVGFVPRLDNIEFKKIDWQVIKQMKNTLVVVSAVTMAQELKVDSSEHVVLNEIKYLNNRDTAFYVVRIN